MQKLIHTDGRFNRQEKLDLYPGRPVTMLDSCSLEFRFSNQDDNSDDGYQLFETNLLKQFEDIYLTIENIVYKGAYKSKYKKAIIEQKFKEALQLFAIYDSTFKNYTEFNAPFFETSIRIYFGKYYPEIVMICMYRYDDCKTHLTKFLVNYHGKAEQFENIQTKQPSTSSVEERRGGTVNYAFKYRRKEESRISH